MKDAYYFPHDSNAHNDPKILKLRVMKGWEAVGLYWTFIELLRDCPGYKYPYDIATLELGLSTPQATIEATLEACFEVGLLVKYEQVFHSPALDRRMAEIDNKREIFREAGRRGGLKSSQAQATLKPGSSHPQAVKERKEKKSKYIAPEKLDELIETKLGKIATKDMIKSVLKTIPEKMWWKVDKFLKERYQCGGNGFEEAQNEIRRQN